MWAKSRDSLAFSGEICGKPWFCVACANVLFISSTSSFSQDALAIETTWKRKKVIIKDLVPGQSYEVWACRASFTDNEQVEHDEVCSLKPYRTEVAKGRS